MIETIADRFEQADLYYGHGTDNSWDEAVQLVLHVMGLPADSDRSVSDYPVSEEQREQMICLSQARIERRVPLPYITHQAWFADLPFFVDERVLIPRSPFAELIKRRFEPWIKTSMVKRILEIGTGSGCMAIAAARAFPEAAVVASDIDPDALEVAKKNVATYSLEQRVQLVASDVYDRVPAQQFDIIMSNPPYVPDEELQTVPPEYQHEPRSALRADDSGLQIVFRIMQGALDYLAEHGILVVEVGNSAQALQKALPRVPFTWLEFEFGGEGVFLLTADQLKHYKEVIANVGK